MSGVVVRPDPLLYVEPLTGGGAILWVTEGGRAVGLETDALKEADKAKAYVQRAIAQAYWRGMLAPEIRWLESEADAMARTDADVEMRAAWLDLFEANYRRRAARLRAIADGPMWEPWYARKVGA